MVKISYDSLPSAVEELHSKLDKITTLLMSVPEAKSNQEKPLSVEEAAEFLNLSVPTIYSKVSKKEIPVMKMGKRLYFDKRDLLDQIKSGRIKTVAELQSDADTFLTKKSKRS